jgi:uncharacterized protein with ATP-grasp and redox domains
MIALSPECFPCFFRQADLAARAHSASEEPMSSAVWMAAFGNICKCPVVSRALGLPEGDLVVLDGECAG